jgi:hypothetical protein
LISGLVLSENQKVQPLEAAGSNNRLRPLSRPFVLLIVFIALNTLSTLRLVDWICAPPEETLDGVV